MSIPIIRQQNVIQDSTQSTILFILQVVRLRVFFLWCILEHVIISGAIIHSKSHKDSMSCQLAINSFTMQLMMSKFSVQDFYYIANAIQNSHVWSCTHRVFSCRLPGPYLLVQQAVQQAVHNHINLCLPRLFPKYNNYTSPEAT